MIKEPLRKSDIMTTISAPHASIPQHVVNAGTVHKAILNNWILQS